MIFSAFSALLACAAGCAVDPRTGRDAANALADGPVRSFGGEQAVAVARAAALLARAVAPLGDLADPPDLDAGRAAWGAARAAYDQGAPVFLAVAPEVPAVLDGRLDDPLTRGGLRLIEAPLFREVPGPLPLLREQALRLADDAARLPGIVADRRRRIDIGDLLASLSALAAVTATKVDGSDSPYAGQSHLSILHDLRGQQAIYQPLRPLVAAVDPALDEQITATLGGLVRQVQELTDIGGLADKVGFLRGCADLSQAFLRIGPALGSGVSAPIDVT